MKKILPKISVIIPVYNVLPYLQTCLESILNQTCSELEIICVNDGSTDGSDDILREYAKKDSRIIILDQPNQGLSVARNSGLEIAQGEYIAFVDSDDWLNIHSLDILWKKATKEQLDMLMFEADLLDDETQETSFYSYTDYSGFLSPEIRKKTFSYLDFSSDWSKLWNFPVMAWSTLWRREFLDDYHLRFPPGLCFEDNLFFHKAFFRAQRIGIHEQSFYYYRQRTTSITGKKAQHFKDLCSIISLEVESVFRDVEEVDLKRHFLASCALPHLYWSFWSSSFESQIENFSKVKSTLDELLDYCRDNDFYESLYSGIRELIESMRSCSNGKEWMKSYFLSAQGVIDKLRDLEPFYYKFHSESSAPSLIGASSEKLFAQEKLDFKNCNCLTQDANNYNLVFQGEKAPQGTLSPDFSISLCSERIRNCIIFPLAFHDCLEFIYLLDERFTVFCKDWESFCYCKLNNYRARFLLADDLIKPLEIREFLNQINFENPASELDPEQKTGSILVTLPDDKKGLLLLASNNDQKDYENFELIDLSSNARREKEVFQSLRKERDTLINNMEWMEFLQSYMQQNGLFMEKISSKRIHKIHKIMHFISMFIILPKARRKFLNSYTFKSSHLQNIAAKNIISTQERL